MAAGVKGGEMAGELEPQASHGADKRHEVFCSLCEDQ